MSEGLMIDIKQPKNGTLCHFWGTFAYDTKMPWGQWILTSEPEVLFSVGNIEVLECLATELIEDESGVVPQGTAGFDPCLRHFIVGRKKSGEVVWWHSLLAEYDREKGRFVENSIILEGKKVVVRGYEGCGPHKGKTIRIDAETGVKSVT